MNPEVKAHWITALRSGHYKQGQNALHDHRHSTYCCLGVLCDVLKEQLKINWIIPERRAVAKFDGEDEDLPESVREIAGLTESQTTHLVQMNDIECANFHKIADHIEKHL